MQQPPPHTLKNIPVGVERRLSDNSANQKLFEKEIPIYNAELYRAQAQAGIQTKNSTKPTKEEQKIEKLNLL